MFAPETFAREWVAAWNRGDLEVVLAWFAEDTVFVSQTAAAVTGQAEVRGKAALRAYWAQALRSLPAPLQFTLDAFFWDAERRAILVVFLSTERARTVRKAELMQFGADGLIHRGEGFAGAVLAPPAVPDPAEASSFRAAVSESGSGFVFFQNKLGGEISIPATDRSPELAFGSRAQMRRAAAALLVRPKVRTGHGALPAAWLGRRAETSPKALGSSGCSPNRRDDVL